MLLRLLPKMTKKAPMQIVNSCTKLPINENKTWCNKVTGLNSDRLERNIYLEVLQHGNTGGHHNTF